MYINYFGLRELPFTLVPNTRFYFEHAGAREALNVLKVALEGGEGFIKVTGEVGTGKTFLCRRLLNLLEKKCFSAFVPNPSHPSVEGFLGALASEFGLSAQEASAQDWMKRINERLIALNHQHKRVVLLLDEAQTIPDESLEAIRLLSNLETEQRKLLHVVLFAQPELDERLEQRGLRQLKQRIAFSYRLQPIGRQELQSYLNHRMTMAGFDGPALFSPGAVRVIHRASGGILRLANVLAHKSLMALYGKGGREVLASHARMAVADTESIPRRRPWLWRVLSLGLTGIALFLLYDHSVLELLLP